MKQETLASDIGCHSTYISQLESGKRRASLEIALKLDRALQLKPGTLLGEAISEHLLSSGTQTVATRHLLHMLLTKTGLPNEDITLLTEEDWTLLKSIVEPVVLQLMQQRSRVRRHSKRLTSKFIFVIEDETKECQAITDILHSRGFKCDYANNGREALKRLVQHREAPDLILLDLRMPKMDGIQFLKRLKKLKLRSKVLVLTAYPGDVGELHANGNGAIEGCLEKPVRMDDLLQKIETLLVN